MAMAASRSGLWRMFSSITAFTPPPPASVKRPADPNTNLFISGLNKRTTTEGLKAAFEKFGQVVHARVLTEPNFAYSKGFGFMKYGTLEEAAEGIKGIGRDYLDGWAIFTEYTKPKAPPSPPLYLYPSRCSLRWMMSRRFLTTQAQTITGADGGSGSRSRVNPYSYSTTATSNSNNSRVSSSSLSSSPWLMLSSPKNPQTRYFYDIISNSASSSNIKLNRKIHLPEITGHHCIGSSQGFLITIDISRTTQIHLTNPLLKPHLHFTIPPIASLPLCTNHRYPFTNLFFGAHKTWISPPKPPILLDTRYELLYQSRAILSPSLDTLILLRKRQLPVFAHATDDNTWTWSPQLPLQYPMSDAIFHKGLLHAISAGGSFAIYDLNISSTSSPKTLFLGRANEFHDPIYLVESPDGNDLFLVSRLIHPGYTFDPDPRRTIKFQVFKIELHLDHPNTKKIDYGLKEVDSIGDIAMFVGTNQSLAVYARDFPSLKPNCIYFTDKPVKRNLLQVRWIGDSGVYNIKDKEVKDYFQLADGIQEQLNWPMPIWYSPTPTC